MSRRFNRRPMSDAERDARRHADRARQVGVWPWWRGFATALVAPAAASATTADPAATMRPAGLHAVGGPTHLARAVFG